MFIDTPDLVIKSIAVIVVIFWQLYWVYTERIADREKPKKIPSTWFTWFKMRWTSALGILFLIQALGYNIFPFDRSVFTQLIGLAVVIAGACIGITARKTLSTNWTHAFEYQIKKDHELVTTGIYSYIRHPIYLSVTLMYTGVEIILSSYLFILFLVGMMFLGYLQGKREETLLRSHFGKQYEGYMKRTKMLIPFLV